MKFFVTIFCLLCYLSLVASPQAASGDVVDTDWFSNATTIENVIDPPGPMGPERLRLQGGFNSGFAEGIVVLPENQMWEIAFGIQTDGNFDIPEEYVDIFINGAFIERIFNSPLGTLYDISHTIVGDQFDYRFEFSSPSIDEGSHLIVERGLATSIPEPQSLTIFAAAFVPWLTRKPRSHDAANPTA